MYGKLLLQHRLYVSTRGGLCTRRVLPKLQVQSIRGTCRTATGDCDVGEVCTGTDGQCPTDKHKRDGISCSNEKAYCFGGTCQTRDRQCTVLWGEGSRASEDICYERLNIIGNSSGNCGKDGDRWIPCAPEDVFCGYLFCNGDTSNLKVGKMLAYTSEEFNRNGHIIECKGAQIFREDGFPLGYVNDGTICGDGKVCLGNKCTTVTRLNTLGNIMVREKHRYARTEAFPQKTNRLRNTNVHSFHSSHSTRVNDGNSRTDVPKNAALTERNATEQRCATTTHREPVFTKDRDLNPGRDRGNVARNFVVGRKRGEVATLRKLLGTSTETDTGMEEMITTNTTIGESVNTTGKIGYNLTLEGTSAPPPENRQESTTERTVSGGATLGSNTIIGTVIACVFLVAVVFGATSIGFKKVKRRRSLMQARRQHPYFISLGGRPICRQPLGGKPRKKKQYRRGEKHDNTRPYRDVKTKKLRSPATHQPFHDGDDIVAVEPNLSTSTTSKVTHTLHSADTTV
ncbi:uncharacterized protein [Ptychodera flava]|uniref:uncharacterized protein isoform X4 n=1 Tax=Ptychodera flava TaxID=63121 RepID=UPI00396A42BC